MFLFDLIIGSLSDPLPATYNWCSSLISSLVLLMSLVLSDAVMGALLSGVSIDAAHTCISIALCVEPNLPRCRLDTIAT